MVLAIIQARTSSSRFPNKVLADLHGAPMLARQIERVLRCALIDKLVVATSSAPNDDAVEDIAHEAGVACYRGSLGGVFDRLYRCAEFYNADHVVRLTGDCPLTDPIIIDDVISTHVSGGMDYTSNVEPCTFPDGLDVEVFTFAAMQRCHEALSMAQEHVTTLFRRAMQFKIGRFRNAVDYSKYRWTVDYPSDLERVRRIYADLYDDKPDFGWLDIMAWEARHGRSTK